VTEQEIGIGRRSLEYIGGHRKALGLIRVKQLLGRAALRHQRKLPAEIVGVAQAGVHSLSAEWAMDVCRIPGKQNPAAAVAQLAQNRPLDVGKSKV